METYYKVVGKDLTSYNVYGVIFDPKHPLKVQYKINQWVHPSLEGSHLFVFDNLKNARSFCGEHRNMFIIFSCHIKGKSRKPLFAGLYHVLDNLNVLLKQKKNHKKTKPLLFWLPLGTIGCKEVMLLEQIDPSPRVLKPDEN